MAGSKYLLNWLQYKGLRSALINLLSVSFTIFPVYRFDGNALGVIDSQGKVIIPDKYSQIQYLGHGLYVTRNIEPGLRPGDSFQLFDRSGQEIKVKVPANSKFAGVYSLGDNASDKEICRTHRLPKGCLFVFSKDNRYGLANDDGTIALPAKQGTIDSINGGLPLIFDNAVGSTYPNRECYAKPETVEQYKNTVYTFNNSTKTLEKLVLPTIYTIAPEYTDGRRSFSSLAASCIHACKDPDGKVGAYQVLHGFLDQYGKIAIEPKYNRAGVYQDGKALVTVYPGGTRSGDFFIIDKDGRRVSPEGIAVMQKWGDVFIAKTAPTDGNGLLNSQGKWILPPTNSYLFPMTDGSFYVGNRKERNAVVVTAEMTEVSRMTNADCDRKRVILKFVQKSQYSPSLAGRPTQYPQIADNAFYSPENGSLEITGKGIATRFSPYPPQGGYGDTLTPFTTAQSAKFWPYIANAEAEPDRFIMREARGLHGFDSTSWKDTQERLHHGPEYSMVHANVVPPRTPLAGFSPLDMFSRFLHQYDLIGMSKAQVTALLGPYCQRLLLSASICTGPGPWIEIIFQNNQVCSWRYCNGPEIRENIVLVPELTQVPEKKGLKKSESERLGNFPADR